MDNIDRIERDLDRDPPSMYSYYQAKATLELARQVKQLHALFDNVISEDEVGEEWVYVKVRRVEA